MKKHIIACIVSALLFSAACHAATYTLIGSNKGDSDGPAVGKTVHVYLAAANTNASCNPYVGRTDCAADCSTSPSDCTEVGTLVVDADSVVLSPSFDQDTASVWVGYDGHYFQCTPALAASCADTITAHMGGCLGNS